MNRNHVESLNDDKLKYNQKNTWLYQLCLISSLVVGIAYLFLRIGFKDNAIIDVFKAFSVLAFILAFPFFKSIYKLKYRHKQMPFFFTKGFSVFIGILMLVVLNNINRFIPISVILFLAAFFFLFCYARMEIKTFLERKTWIRFGLFVIAGLFLCISSWAYILNNPLYFEQVVLGDGMDDNLFFSAITNMIQSYNVPCTGLDGIIYYHYHWFSYFVFSNIIELINASPFTFFNLYYPMVFYPLFIFVVFEVIETLMKTIGIQFRFNLIHFVLLLTFFSEGMSRIFGIRTFVDSFILTSPSYLFALLLSFVFCTCIIEYGIYLKNNQKFTTACKFFVFVLIPIFTILILASKISFIPYLFSVLGWLCLRYRKYFLKHLGALLLCCCFVFLLLNAITFKNNNLDLFYPFKTVKHYIDLPYFSLFIYYIWFWVFFFFFNPIKKEKYNLLKKQTYFILPEIVVIMHFIGLFLLIFIFFGSGNAVRFFSDIPRWYAFIFAICYLPEFTLKELKKNFLENKLIYKAKIIGGIVLFFFLILLTFKSFFVEWKKIIVDNVNIRIQILENSTNPNHKPKDKSFFKILLDKNNSIQKALVAHPDYPLMSKLDSINRAIKNDEKSKYCIYIPYNNKLFWEKKYRMNSSRPFLVPAITGICGIQCLPKSAINYSYEEYNLFNYPKIYNETEIIEKAKKMGFIKIIYIQQIKQKLKISVISI